LKPRDYSILTLTHPVWHIYVYGSHHWSIAYNWYMGNYGTTSTFVQAGFLIFVLVFV